MREYARLQTANLLRRFAFQLNRIAPSGDAEAIHDLRVSIRRLNRCLRVFSQFYPDQSARKIRRQLAAVMALAGDVRDRDVAMELLAEAGVSRRSAVVARLQAERRTALRELLLEVVRLARKSFSQHWRARLEL
jgi:CHAD domain-containing protein